MVGRKSNHERKCGYLARQAEKVLLLCQTEIASTHIFFLCLFFLFLTCCNGWAVQRHERHIGLCRNAQMFRTLEVSPRNFRRYSRMVAAVAATASCPLRFLERNSSITFFRPCLYCSFSSLVRPGLSAPICLSTSSSAHEEKLIISL